MKRALAKQISDVWDRIIEETNDELSTEQMFVRVCHDVETEGIKKPCDSVDVAEALFIMQGGKP